MRKSALLASAGAPATGRAGLEPGAARRAGLLAGILALGFLALALAVLPQPASLPDLTQRQAGESYGKLPLSFVPNKGQTDSSVRYQAQGPGFGFYFTRDEAVLSFQKGERGHALHLGFPGASADATLAPERQGHGTVNYLRGDDPRKWQTGLPTYGQLAYQGLWPGVDMRFRGAGGKLKYEFRLAAGANPERIRLAYRGASGLSVSRGGSLLIRTRLGTLRDSAPRAWQQIGGRKVPVQSRYSLKPGAGGALAYGFELGAYDHGHPLVVDPGLIYSTYVGGSSGDIAESIAIDGDGSAYVTGRTDSGAFPSTPGAYDVSYNGSFADVVVTKLNEDGSALSYSTFLGGTDIDQGNAIAVDGAGNAYVTGDTSSSDFPTTPGALDATLDGNEDAFVTKLSADGSALTYSTYLGGTDNIDSGNDITVDAAGNAFVTGDTISPDFPTTPGAFDTTASSIYSAFVTKLDPAGAALVYSTYLGGSGSFDFGNGIEVDGTGSAYVAGSTSSANFPTTVGAYDTTHNGADDAFVTKLDATGSTLAYSTFIGGSSFDGASGVGLDAAGNSYLTGATGSSDFPTTVGAFDTSYNSDTDGYVTKLNATGSALSYSTFLGGTGAGGTGYDAGRGIAVDGAGFASVTGRTDSLVFPTTANALQTVHNGTGGDAFLTRLNAVGTGLVYSTFLGGTGTDQGSDLAIDGVGNTYVAGYTTSSNFPVTAEAFDATSNGGNDVFITKIGPVGYARPRSATPVTVRLVPAHTECTVPNSLHGAPLTQPSCNPADPASGFLTVGAPESNGKQTNFSGYIKYKVLGESPVNPGNGDQADVELTVSITDVRNQSDLTDYTGEVQVLTVLRITDMYNGPTLTEPGTVTDLPFSFTVPCAATPNPDSGSTCSVLTTADSLLADTAREGKRSIWELGQTQVFDGGPDGDVDTANNTLFAVQGLFAP